jgi:hypothetical protein
MRSGNRRRDAGRQKGVMTRDQKIIKGTVGLLELARQLGNVSQACKMLGDRSDSFYRNELYDKGGELALQEMSRKKPILANRIAPEIEARIVEFFRWRRRLSARSASPTK